MPGPIRNQDGEIKGPMKVKDKKNKDKKKKNYRRRSAI